MLTMLLTAGFSRAQSLLVGDVPGTPVRLLPHDSEVLELQESGKLKGIMMRQTDRVAKTVLIVIAFLLGAIAAWTPKGKSIRRLLP